MIWNSKLSDLQNVLAELYWDKEDARHLTVVTGINPSRISFDSRADITWQSILERAIAEERLVALVAQAQAENPAVALLNQVSEDELLAVTLSAAAGEAGREATALGQFEPETVLIPAGSFLLGSSQDGRVEAPQHLVDLPAFRMGMYPITNQEYAQFVWETGRNADAALLWHGNIPPDDKLAHPVTGVTWYEALAYCRWLTELSGRQYLLPTEAQWEKAARGENGRLYPWGNEWDAKRCNADPNLITVVDAFPAQSPYGCYDMVGNAREWTATLWGTSAREPDKRYRYPWTKNGRNHLNAPSTTWRVVRGGRYRNPAEFRCTLRRGHPPTDYGPRRNRHGFRVVQLVGTSDGT